jgi:Tol biopolymer transport system component
VADLNGEPALYARPVGAVNFRKLVTGAIAQPFWSPDSTMIGFVLGGKLKRVSITGGAAQDIAGVSSFAGGTWNRDGTILFGSDTGVFRVSAEGGTPAPATTLDPEQAGHFWPSFLPDGQRFLYLGWSGEAGKRALFVGKLDSKDKTRLMASEAKAVYAAPGYLVFQREVSLFAQPFNGSALSGKPVLLADQVGFNATNGRGYFDVSPDSLFYFQGSPSAAGGRAGTGNRIQQLGWMDRTGSFVTVAGEQVFFGDFDLSPDGKLIALTRQESAASTADIWVVDWQRAGAATRLTLDPADDLNPVWSPDGARIAFTTFRKGNADIYVKNANGVGPETPLLETPAGESIEDWSKDGRYIAYLSGPDELRDIYVLPLGGDKKPFPVVHGHFRKDEPQFSDDGKWLAYTSNETGVFQVNVVSFPALDQKLQVSVSGGGQPRWRKDSGGLYFRDPETNNIMMVEIKRSPKLEAAGAPQPLFPVRPLAESQFKDRDATRHQLSVTPDGLRFLLRVSVSYGNNPAAARQPTVPQAAMPRGFAGLIRNSVPGGNPERGLTVIRHWSASL